MRNTRLARGSGSFFSRLQKLQSIKLGLLGITAIGLMLLTGCVDAPSKDRLNEGYHALDAQRYDEAGAAANDYLTKHPTGPGAAEAYYLQGRAYESRSVESHEAQSAARADLDAARIAYNKGLTLQASPAVKALLHSGLANVAYFQENYAIAADEWQAAYPNLKDQDAKAWALYRIGLSQQRLGAFKQADDTFTLVQEQFPSSEAAGRATTRIGAKAFYVQIGAYESAANAQKTVDTLARSGLPTSSVPESANRHVVRVGPAATYADAKVLRSRVIGEYPQAIILP